jgi:hypothetical protein
MQSDNNADICNSTDRPSPCDNTGNSANKGHKHFSYVPDLWNYQKRAI